MRQVSQPEITANQSVVQQEEPSKMGDRRFPIKANGVK
jgi:hypothetical protein